MKEETTKKLLSVAAAAFAANFAFAGEYDEIVDEGRAVGIYAYDVEDYVQDGLVAHFDGIRNAGKGKPHDSSATEWIDLARDGHVANFFTTQSAQPYAPLACYDGKWTDNGYAFPGNVYARMDEEISLGANFTVQLALDVDVSSQTTPYPTWAGITGNKGFFTRGTGTSVEWNMDTWVGGKRAYCAGWEGKYITGMNDSKSNYCFQCATTQGTADGSSRKERTEFSSLPENRWSLCGAWNAGNGENWATERYAIGELKNARFYNRALTDDELAWNRKIDEFRFRGAYNVEVASTVPGAAGTESLGIYEVNGHHDFTADANATVDGVEYAAVGYAVEIWDSANGVWGKPQEYTGTTYAYTNCEATAKVRLTWMWKPVRGLVKYDVTAYAQNGLVINFDGISNQGVGSPHSANAAEWTNCGSADASATVVRLETGDAGAWTERGRHERRRLHVHSRRRRNRAGRRIRGRGQLDVHGVGSAHRRTEGEAVGMFRPAPRGRRVERRRVVRRSVLHIRRVERSDARDA